MFCEQLYKHGNNRARKLTQRVTRVPLATQLASGYTTAMSSEATDAAHASDRRAFVYILHCADGSYYTGWTTDVDRRVHEHNLGRGARYTRQRRPVRLVYWEVQINRAAAQRREEEIKRRGRRYKERLISAVSSPQPV